jgi:hypothetical protein
VVFATPLVAGRPAVVEVTASGEGRLDAWIDFDGNRDWDGDEEQIFSNMLLLPGRNTLFFSTATSAIVTDPTYARFRFSSTGGLSSRGLAVDGEVEDYAVAVQAPAAGNQPPTAGDDEASTILGAPVAVDVTANDSDPDGLVDPTTVTIVSPPTSGSAFVDPASGVITYVPLPGFVGDDELVYRVADKEGLVDTASVLVHVLPGNLPPVAEDDAAATDEDTPVTIDVATNDSDPEGALDSTSVRLRVSPEHGAVEIDPTDGSITYTPEPDFHGTDRFVYEIADALSAWDWATVTVAVAPVNDPPVATDDLAETFEHSAVVVDVLANDHDADGDLDPGSVFIGEGPAHGTAAVDPQTGQVTYTPAAGFLGVDGFSYQVADAQGASAVASVTVLVLPLNTPPEAHDDLAGTDEETPVVIDVLANDTDMDGALDPGSVRILVPPFAGSAEVDPVSGAITYTPWADRTGSDFLVYGVSDTDGATSLAVVTVQVDPVNDPPTAVDDLVMLDEGCPAALPVLANDADPDGWIDPATLAILLWPTGGSAEIKPDGTILYTPAEGFSGTDQLTYTVRDDEGSVSNTASVEIQVRPMPAAWLGGRVFEDPEGDGPDADDVGLPGVTIRVYDLQGQLVAASQTAEDDPATTEDESGRYRIAGLPGGMYVVAQVHAPGWVQTYPADQGVPLPDPVLAPGIHVVSVGPRAPAEHLDFANQRTAGEASIGGFVYLDTDNDGIKDSDELGLQGIPVHVAGPVAASVLTAADGSYRFDSLPPGMYNLIETQPCAFLDGIDTPGTPSPCTSANDCFFDVVLPAGTEAVNYNFAERGLIPELISKRLFLASTPPLDELVLSLNLSQDDLWLGFEAAENEILSAELTGYDGEAPVIELYRANWMPVAISAGSPRLEAPVTEGAKYVLHVSGSGSEASLRLTNAVGQGGGHEVISGTDGDDVFEFGPGSTPGYWTVKVNGVTHEVQAETVAVEFDGVDGNDRVMLTGTQGNETLQLWPGRGTFAGTDCTVTVANVESIIVAGGGGTDVALLRGAPGVKDTFRADPDGATMSGDGYSNQVLACRYVHGYGNPGDQDVAMLWGNPATNDTFESWPETDMARMIGPEFYNRVKSFRWVHAYSTSGNLDMAYLHDDPGQPDTFESWPEMARLYASDHYTRVKSFRWVHGYGSTGNQDVAYLHGNPEAADTFQAWPTMARLYGAAYYNRVKSFAYVHGYGTPGNEDMAQLHGSAGNDGLLASGRSTALYGSGFYNRAVLFDQVEANACGGTNTARLYDAVLEAGLVHRSNVDAILWLCQFDRINQHDTETDEDTATEALDEIFTAYWP